MAEKEEKLSGAQRGKIRRLTAPHEPTPDEEAGEINIVPFLDIIMNVLMFVLASVTATFMTTIDVASPRAGRGGGRPEQNTLSLTVIVVPDGYSIKAKGGNVGPGCADMGAGLAVPKKPDGSYDHAKLTECAAKLKNSNEDFADETSVSLTGNPETPYSVMIETIDALRHEPSKGEGDKPKLLFPDVMFSVIR
jgi:biopolymer transport protein ExbD